MNLELKIYGKDEDVVRVAKGKGTTVKFGIIRRIMKLIDIEKETNSFEVMKKVLGAWEEVEELLGSVFPDVTEEEWDNVDIGEVSGILIEIAKMAMKRMAGIPTDPNTVGA